MNPKHNIKVLGIAFVAVLTLSAVATGVARVSAPRWVVKAGGGPASSLATSKSMKVKGSSTGNVLLVLEQAIGITLMSNTADGDCAYRGSVDGSTAGGPGTGREGVLTCHNVLAYSGVTNLKSSCSVRTPGQPNGTIVSSKLKSTLVWLSPTGSTEVGAVFAPETGNAFFTFELRGDACDLAQKVTVIGSVTAGMEPIDMDEERVVFSALSATTFWTNRMPRAADVDPGLSLGGSSVMLDGSLDLTLDRALAGSSFGVKPG